MTTTLEAIYEDGKLVLTSPLPLPDHAHVRVTIESGDAAMSDSEREGWLRLSEESLTRAWDDPEDDVFSELLTK